MLAHDSRFLRLFTAVAFLTAAVTFIADNAVHAPDLNGPGTRVLDKASRGLDALQTGTWLDVVYALVIPLAMLGLAALVRGRGGSLVFAGAAITTLGNLVHAAVIVIQVLAIQVVGGDQMEMARLWDRVNADPHLLPLMVLIVLFPLGQVILTVGLARAGMVHWSLIPLAVGMVVVDFAHFPGSHDILALAVLAYSIALSLALVLPSGGIRITRLVSRTT